MVPGDQGVGGCWFGLRLKQQAYRLLVPEAPLPPDPRGSFLFTTDQNIEVANIGSFNDGIAAPKFTNKTSTGANGSDLEFPDTDFPMFRLGDAYLIYAEAHLRAGGGDRAQALAYVNALRERAAGDASFNITDGELSEEFILDERGRELLWEAHRRTDLVRYGQFTGGDYLWAWKGGVVDGRATSAHLDLYPLPASELTTNPNLTQNPGY